ncbi:MAG: PD-(D/E)XK motif protein [Planctomycetota bacterium]
MTRQEVEAIWGSIERPTARGDYAGRRVPDCPAERPIFAVIDSEGRRSLFVSANDDDPTIPAIGTTGLSVATDVYRIGSRQASAYIALTCRRPEQFATFTAVCADALDGITQQPADPVGALRACLDRWKAFWRVKQDGLSREAALGLFAELWFLHFWLSCSRADALARWTGPVGARHDFQWPTASVEVKATASAQGVVHRISSLDQLEDPVTGILYLFSLHVADDALSGNTLPKLVQLVRSSFMGDAPSLEAFDSQLANLGYSPAHADRYDRRFRVVGERLYCVSEAFPRLTRTAMGEVLPPAVQDVSYTLDLAACEEHRIASAAQELVDNQLA